MAEKRGKGGRPAIELHSPVCDNSPVSDPSALDPPASDFQLARTRIRQCWEFASVLNFLHVFKPIIGSDLKISAEEIEAALITPNEDSGRLHVALLKGIPPVNKNMTNGDAWITVLCKKLASWWQWVAEGQNPLEVDHGNEIQKYKELDPVIRIAILKALCEVRALQDDVCSYISDELKKGTSITTFRKERMGGTGNGVSYWHDGDPVIGHRLYREVIRVESKPKPKGKGRGTGPMNACQWETLATELEEFQKISDNLSSSKNSMEAAVGEIIKAEIVPVLQELQKKKERAWKRQQREALQLNAFLDCSRVGSTRSCRERRPVCYTFDEFDRSIDEAIQISKKQKTTGSKKDKVKQVERPSLEKDAIDETEKVDQGSSEDEIHESMPDVEVSKHHHGSGEDDDDDETEDEKEEVYKHQSESDNDQDDDYDEKEGDRGESNIEEDEEDDDDDNDDCAGSDTEDDSPDQKQNKKYSKTKAVAGLRRSQRFVEPTKGPAETKKRLRQRLTRNSAKIVSDSEDSSQENEHHTEIVSDTEMEDSASSGNGSQEDADDVSDE